MKWLGRRRKERERTKETRGLEKSGRDERKEGGDGGRGGGGGGRVEGRNTFGALYFLVVLVSPGKVFFVFSEKVRLPMKILCNCFCVNLLNKRRD